jgi:excisionase family DNA binding protein
VGGHPEKLLTPEETARRLGLPAEGVEELILEGKLPSFRLAGNLLRFRLRDVERLRLQRQGKRPRRSTSVFDRISDFFYFNNFYLIAFLILLTLVAIIYTF